MGSNMNTYNAPYTVSSALRTLLAIRCPFTADRFNALYRDSGNPSVDAQLQEMNRFLCYQFATLPHCTMELRSALMFEKDFNGWVAMVGNVIVPQLIAHQLPVDLMTHTNACSLTI